MARGGMAEVWAAQQYGKHGFQRTVAIKTILSQHASDSRARRMFLEEARLVASVRHPNVTEIYDFGEEREVLFMALEYVEGDSVLRLHRAYRSEGGLPPPLALRVVADACLGLHAAHEHMSDDGTPATIIHRDVSPQNILCSTSGAVKLIDFGIARMTGAMHQDTTGGLKGKVHYMAPEQALGRPVDRRADIWGLGATLFKLLEGRPPLAGANELETLHLLTSGAAPPEMKNAPAQVQKIVQRALQYEPEDRFQSAEEMYAELDDTIAKIYGRVTQRDLATAVTEQLATPIEERRQQLVRAKHGAVERAKLARELEIKAVVSGDASDSGDTTAPGSPPVARATALQSRPARALPRPALRAAPPRSSFAVRAGVAVGLVLFAVMGLTVLLARRAVPDPQPPTAEATPVAMPMPAATPLPSAPAAASAPTLAAVAVPESAPSSVAHPPAPTAAASTAPTLAAPKPMPARPAPQPRSPLDVVTDRK